MNSVLPSFRTLLRYASVHVPLAAALCLTAVLRPAGASPIMSDGPGAYGTGPGGNGSTSPGVPKPWLGGTAGLNTATGNKLTAVPITGWSTRGGLPISFALYHNSNDVSDANSDSQGWGTPARKWRYSYDSIIVSDLTATGQVFATLTWDDGSITTFTKRADGLYVGAPGEHGTLTAPNNSTFEYGSPTQVHYLFPVFSDHYCRLTSIHDLNGNTISIARQTSAPFEVVSVGCAGEPGSRSLTLTWSGTQLASVQDALGRQWQFGYTTQGTGTSAVTSLVSVTLPTLNDGHVYQGVFTYNARQDITSLGLAMDGVAHPSILGYNDPTNVDAVTDVTDSMGNHSSVAYTGAANASGTTVMTDPNGHQATQVYSNGLLDHVVDALNVTTGTYTFDSNNNLKVSYDSKSNPWLFDYDASGTNQTSIKNPDNPPFLTTYNALNEPTDTYDALNHHAQVDYDPATGNVNSILDPNINRTTLTTPPGNYGLPTQATNAAGVTQFGYNGLGQMVWTADPSSVQHRLSYNTLGWLTSDNDILGNTSVYMYDNWGRVTSIQQGGAAQRPLYRLDAGPGAIAATPPYDNGDNRIYAADANLASTLAGGNWLTRGAMGYLYLNVNAQPGLAELHRLSGSGQQFYTADPGNLQYFVSNGWADQGIVGYVYPPSTANTAGLTPMYRAWNSSNNHNLFTTGYWEYNNLAAPWQKQGVFCYLQAQAGSMPTVARCQTPFRSEPLDAV